MTPLEVSVLTGYCVVTIKRYDHVLQPIRTASGRRFYLRSKVEAWIADGARRAAEVQATDNTEAVTP